MTIINFAHRGASGYCPENTMAAFEKAAELGATGIETDVHLTADGEVVCTHDEHLGRTIDGTGFVKDYTFAELSRMDAGGWFHEQFAGEKVPLLRDLVQHCVKHKLILNIELKTGIVLYPDIERKVIDIVKQYDWLEHTIISSFNHYALVECKRIEPAIETAILYSSGLYEPWKYADLVRAETLHPAHYTAVEPIVKLAQANGKKVNVWTINDEDSMKRFVAYGVNGVITDFPDKLNDILKGK